MCVHGSTGWPLPYVIRADAKQRFEIALRDPPVFRPVMATGSSTFDAAYPAPVKNHAQSRSSDEAATVIAISHWRFCVRQIFGSASFVRSLREHTMI